MIFTLKAIEHCLGWLNAIGISIGQSTVDRIVKRSKPIIPRIFAQ
ncbi:hypothetical protein SAJA_14760 [Salinisphaera japonica YTM-1]|uniref:Transposase n=1 Tax=Salinisphaera japonica YTM-1 TaxID=1209778 RepID=A0A423PEV6_9GAMM|nr:hypothetical protein SAJA_14760 [Salinisphaera japonica YTM-1]